MKETTLTFSQQELIDYLRQEDYRVIHLTSKQAFRIKFFDHENSVVLDSTVDQQEIHIEGINANQKGSGVGRTLVELIKEFCAEKQRILFAEDVHNIDFFSKQGFEPTVNDPDNPYGYKSQWVCLDY